MERLRMMKLAADIRAAQSGTRVPQTDYTGFRDRVQRMTERLIDALFPNYASVPTTCEQALEEAAELAERCLMTVLCVPDDVQSASEALFFALPEIRRRLELDLYAAYRGDPAARDIDEIVLCYPAFFAIAVYRLAHVLYRAKVPLLPRVMTEFAHTRTGIDIHPGAEIGDGFFIDHGTGVVIGETTTIGSDVKIYQHVTLGAKSFDVGEDGTPVKGIKRHPDIGDRVVIYAGATVLGGQTRIGNDSIIGGSVWLTHSVEAGKMVLARAAVTDATMKRDIMQSSALDSAML
ncbi:MAG: serine acetyltransferase [Clostridia bacterium]|nr:serine acetyltransferase [Clostridia bacterium]